MSPCSLLGCRSLVTWQGGPHSSECCRGCSLLLIMHCWNWYSWEDFKTLPYDGGILCCLKIPSAHVVWCQWEFLHFSAWIMLQMGFISQADKKEIWDWSPNTSGEQGMCFPSAEALLCSPDAVCAPVQLCWIRAWPMHSVLLHHSILTQSDSSGKLCSSESQS